jgi:hypothetical protein
MQDIQPKFAAKTKTKILQTLDGTGDPLQLVKYVLFD